MPPDIRFILERNAFRHGARILAGDRSYDSRAARNLLSVQEIRVRRDGFKRMRGDAWAAARGSGQFQSRFRSIKG